MGIKELFQNIFSTPKKAIKAAIIVAAIAGSIAVMRNTIENNMAKLQKLEKENPILVRVATKVRDSLNVAYHHLQEAEAFFHVDNLVDARNELDKAKSILDESVNKGNLNTLVANSIISSEEKRDAFIVKERIKTLYADITRRQAEKEVYKK